MSDRPVIFIREGTLSGQSIPIDDDSFIIGRGSDCNLTLPERMVSRHHIRIYNQDGQFQVQDLGSKNGTHVNGQPLAGTARLKDGDEIQIALAVKLVYIGTDATMPLAFEPTQTETALLLDEDRRTAIVDGAELDPPLSLAQFRLPKLLYDADGAVCSRDSIVEAVWPGTDGIGVSEQAIDALVRRLRDRLTEVDGHNFVVTVRGHGFRLDNPER